MERKLGNFAMVAQEECGLPRSREAVQCYYNRILIDAAVANMFPSHETNALSIIKARVLQGHHLEENLIPSDGHLTSLVGPPNLITESLRSVRQELQRRRTFCQLGELKANLHRNKIFEANRLETPTSKTCVANTHVQDFAYLAQCKQAVQSYQMLVSPPFGHLHTKAMNGKSDESRGVIDSSASISLPESDSRGTDKDDATNSTIASATNTSSHQTLKMLGLTCLDRRAAKTPYFDASVLQDPDCRKIKQYSRYHRNGVVEPFPEKLYRMLLDVAHEGKEDIISFFPHGRAFVM